MLNVMGFGVWNFLDKSNFSFIKVFFPDSKHFLNYLFIFDNSFNRNCRKMFNFKIKFVCKDCKPLFSILNIQRKKNWSLLKGVELTFHSTSFLPQLYLNGELKICMISCGDHHIIVWGAEVFLTPKSSELFDDFLVFSNL